MHTLKKNTHIRSNKMLTYIQINGYIHMQIQKVANKYMHTKTF